MTTPTSSAILAAAAALAGGLQAVTEAVRTGCADPADAVRLLLQLAAYAPSTPSGDDAIGQAMSTAEAATAALCRRAALASLALAVGDYAPSSYQDAVRVRTKVCAAIDIEMLVAGSQPDYAAFLALRALRNAVVIDITTRAGSLPQIVQVNRPGAMPAWVLAYQLYGDADRSGDLLRRADAVSPMFMPRQFEALSS